MAQTTKNALAACLKALLTEKPLDKITVTDVAERCGVNRQTFYYHFKDIYDLVDWIFLSDAARVLEGKKEYDTWQQGFLQIFEYVQENRQLVRNTYGAVSREQVERYLYDVTYGLLSGVVEEMAAGLSVREGDKRFIADFYKFAFVGLVLDWIKGGMKQDPQALVARVSEMLDGQFMAALERFAR